MTSSRSPRTLENYDGETSYVVATTMRSRTGIVLLDRLGAHAAAKAAATAIPDEWRWVSRARSLLWAGEYEAARRAADAGIYDSAPLVHDRLSLRAVKAGAAFLDPTVAEEAKVQQACVVVGELLGSQVMLPLAMLPETARETLVGLYRANVPSLSRAESLLLSRLGELQAAHGRVPTAVQLTRREKTLLPLLATPDAVPEIAAGLQVSPHTVRKQVVSLRKKFGARNRAELVRLAKDAGALS